MTGVLLGRDTFISISLDDGITFREIAPVNVRDITLSMPTQDVTTQSNVDDQSSMCHTGYSGMSVAVSGIVDDSRSGDNDPLFGQPYYTIRDLLALANMSPVSARRGLFRLADRLDLYEGTFIISEFARTGGRSEVQEFSMTLQNEGVITYLDGELWEFMVFMESTLPDLWAPFL